MSQLSQFQFAISGGGQVDIQFQDQGINLGTSGTVDTVNFTGAGVSASRVGNTVTVDIPGGGGATIRNTDTTVNVPGDFATLSAAIADYESALYIDGARYFIEITAGTTITDQLVFQNVDYGNLQITALGAGCNVDCSGFVPGLLPYTVWVFQANSSVKIAGSFTAINPGTTVGLVAVQSNLTFGDPLTGAGFHLHDFSQSAIIDRCTGAIDGLRHNSPFAVASSILTIHDNTSNSTFSVSDSIISINGGRYYGDGAGGDALNAVRCKINLGTGSSAVRFDSRLSADYSDINGRTGIITEDTAKTELFYFDCCNVVMGMTRIDFDAASVINLVNASHGSRVNLNCSSFTNSSTGVTVSNMTDGCLISYNNALGAVFSGVMAYTPLVPSVDGLILA